MIDNNITCGAVSPPEPMVVTWGYSIKIFNYKRLIRGDDMEVLLQWEPTGISENSTLTSLAVDVRSKTLFVSSYLQQENIYEM